LIGSTYYLRLGLLGVRTRKATGESGKTINIFEGPHKESGNCLWDIKIADVGKKPMNNIYKLQQ